MDPVCVQPSLDFLALFVVYVVRFFVGDPRVLGESAGARAITRGRLDVPENVRENERGAGSAARSDVVALMASPSELGYRKRLVCAIQSS